MLTRRLSYVLGATLLVASGADWIGPVNAQKAGKPAAQEPAKAADSKQQEEGPVALTARTKPAEKAETKAVTKGEFGNMAGPIINNKGEVGFIGRYVPDANIGPGTSFFLYQPDGKISIKMRGTEKLSGLEAPLLSIGSFHFSDAGDTTFSAVLDKPAPCPVSSGEEKCAIANQKYAGLFTTDGKAVKPIAVLGQEVPNSPSTFVGFGASSINTKGAAAFVGTYADPDGRGLFIWDGKALKLVARSGQKSPVGKDNSYSEHFYPSPINERGEVAFFCRVDTGGAIFVYRPGSGIEAIAAQDNPSPIEGSNYIGFANRTPAINSKGEVAFAGFIDGASAGRLLFFHSDGKTKVVLRSGDKLPESNATFSDFNMPSLNSKGEIAFVGNYAGHSRGVFLKTSEGVEAIALYDKFAPGGERVEGNLFNNFLNPVVNEDGTVAFMAQLKDSKIGMFVKKKGQPLQLIAKTGDKMPQ